MALPQLDPRFAEYVREHPTISYAQPDDPWLVKHFISSVEVVFGRRKIESVYRKPANQKKALLPLRTFFKKPLLPQAFNPVMTNRNLLPSPRPDHWYLSPTILLA
jgi:hypothetical protein